MTIVYENVFIGAFVFTLGYGIARRFPNSDPLASVNLYQQTPADPVLGDLLANLRGRNILLEFKRDWRSLYTERKPHRIRLMDLLADKHLSDIAHQCHYLGFGRFQDQLMVSLDFLSYPTAIIENLSSAELYVRTHVLQQFVDLIIEGEAGSEAEEFGQYLQALDDAYGHNQGFPAGLIVSFSQEQGVRFFLCEDVRLIESTRKIITHHINENTIDEQKYKERMRIKT